jgi:hypothetical protein
MRISSRIIALLSAIVLVGSVGAQEQPQPFGPIIDRIEVKKGSAWDVIEQIRSGLPTESPVGLSVEIPEEVLRKVHVELIDVRSVPLGLAVHYLYQVTKAVNPSYEGGIWILRPMTFDGPSEELAVQLYEISEEMLKQIGIDYKEDTGLFDSEGNSWPQNEAWTAKFLPASKQLLLRADIRFHEEIAALLLLAKRGYTDLGIKRL